MGGKNSGRERVSYEYTVTEISELLAEIQDLLSTANKKMTVVSQRVLYYTKTLPKRVPKKAG